MQCCPGGHSAQIVFEDVCFAYESRPNAPVLDHFSLVVPAGKTVALVGSSGCGKSTCIALLQQFYKPTSGKVPRAQHCLQRVERRADLAGRLRHGCGGH